MEFGTVSFGETTTIPHVHHEWIVYTTESAPYNDCW
jgi:hypothetical protein